MENADGKNRKKIRAVFYRSDSGREPVREWLKSLPMETKKRIGKDISKAEFGWPLGLPVVDSIKGYRKLWEIRTDLPDGIARVLFTVYGDVMVLLHGFIKKTQKTPKKELDTADRRRKRLDDDMKKEGA